MRTMLISVCTVTMLAACSREAEPLAPVPLKPVSAPPSTAVQPKDEPSISLEMLLPQIEATTDPALLVEQIGQLGRQDDGSPRVLALCERLLQHPDARVRAAVLEELWFFDDISSLTTNIAACLHDPDTTVRAQAAERLGEIETPVAVEMLIQNLTNSYPDVQTACQEALLMAVAERFDTPEQAYKWWKENRDTWFDE